MISSDLILSYRDKLEKEKILKNVEDINSAVKRSMTLLTDLLSWARTQSGKIEYSPTKFDLSELIYKLKNLVKNNTQIKKQILEIEAPESLIIEADKFMIETILRNLVTNAIKFSNNGGVIKIELKRNDGVIACSVSDNGIGIPEEKINQLFNIDSNYTTYGTNKEKGTGLGLVLCKEFVHLNKGDIFVESKLGEGSKFTFTIPVN